MHKSPECSECVKGVLDSYTAVLSGALSTLVNVLGCEQGHTVGLTAWRPFVHTMCSTMLFTAQWRCGCGDRTSTQMRVRFASAWRGAALLGRDVNYLRVVSTGSSNAAFARRTSGSSELKIVLPNGCHKLRESRPRARPYSAFGARPGTVRLETRRRWSRQIRRYGRDLRRVPLLGGDLATCHRGSARVPASRHVLGLRRSSLASRPGQSRGITALNNPELKTFSHHALGPYSGVDNPGHGHGPSVAETAGTPWAMERRATTFGREPPGGQTSM